MTTCRHISIHELCLKSDLIVAAKTGKETTFDIPKVINTKFYVSTSCEPECEEESFNKVKLRISKTLKGDQQKFIDLYDTTLNHLPIKNEWRKIAIYFLRKIDIENGYVLVGGTFNSYDIIASKDRAYFQQIEEIVKIQSLYDDPREWLIKYYESPAIAKNYDALYLVNILYQENKLDLTKNQLERLTKAFLTNAQMKEEEDFVIKELIEKDYDVTTDFIIQASRKRPKEQAQEAIIQWAKKFRIQLFFNEETPEVIVSMAFLSVSVFPKEEKDHYGEPIKISDEQYCVALEEEAKRIIADKYQQQITKVYLNSQT